VVHCLLQDGQPAAQLAGSKTAASSSSAGSKAKKGGSTSTSSAAAGGLQLQGDWVAEHAAQAARMLPGGMYRGVSVLPARQRSCTHSCSKGTRWRVLLPLFIAGLSVLGCYIFCPDSVVAASGPAICQMLAAVREAVPVSAGRYTVLSDRLLPLPRYQYAALHCFCCSGTMYAHVCPHAQALYPRVPCAAGGTGGPGELLLLLADSSRTGKLSLRAVPQGCSSLTSGSQLLEMKPGPCASNLVQLRARWAWGAL
jgi:hypothetical protein